MSEVEQIPDAISVFDDLGDSKEPKKFLGVYMPVELWLALQAEANRNERTVSAEVRFLLRQHLDSHV